MKLNDTIHNFKLISIEDVKDINARLYQFEHIKSKGLVAYLECDDTNCCFAIGFKTLPEDSTGVCHIIEHSLLCGSKKYPLKEPFVNLLKTSLSTKQYLLAKFFNSSTKSSKPQFSTNELCPNSPFIILS